MRARTARAQPAHRRQRRLVQYLPALVDGRNLAVVKRRDGGAGGCELRQGAVQRRQFGAFKRDRRALADWCLGFAPEVVVMESTGVYWKSPFAALEAVGITAWVVNARHVKAVPGRKTDMADAQWLATLARAGLLRALACAAAIALAGCPERK